MTRGKPIACAICHRPWAHIRGEALYVVQRHDGAWHENSITVPGLEALLSLYTWYTREGKEVYHNCVAYDRRDPAQYLGDGRWKCTHCGELWEPGE